MTQNNLNFIEDIKIEVKQPFNKSSIDFINDFSKELKKNKYSLKMPNLFYLMIWSSKSNILKINDNLKDDKFRLGRGLVFHICPSNVPVNFVYSFFLGLLSGNSNIIKIPSKNFSEKKIIIETIQKLFSKKKYSNIKKSNFFVEYDSNLDIKKTEKISAMADARIIWGGDKTVNNLKKIWTPERCVDLCFSDRYSLSVLDGEKLNYLSKQNLNKLIRKFFYDSYTMNQMACNSPHFVFWVGGIKKEIKKYFWKKLSVIAKEKFKFDDIHVMDKFSNLILNLIDKPVFDKIDMYKNRLYVLDVKQKKLNIENVRGVNGTFFQKDLKSLNQLANFINKKCQTITYFGFNNNRFKKLLTDNNLLGADRIVKIGEGLNFELNWDGYDTIKILSRVVTV